MEITLPWGKDQLCLALPKDWNVIFPRNDFTPPDKDVDECDIVEKSLLSPIALSPLNKYDLRNKQIVIVTDDNTRNTPVYKFFHIVLEMLGKSGAEYSNITVIPALGIHTPMDIHEAANKIGKHNFEKITWVNHDAFDPDANAFFGTTTRGTKVYLNKALKTADFIICIGLIEPHIWAGFGGGMKNILPGVASADTIGYHHGILTENPDFFNSSGKNPDTVPFRRELEETKAMIESPIFCINVVIDHNENITACFSGDPIECHRQGADYCKKLSAVYLDKPVDGIIANSYPMDFNLKQSMKTIGNSIPALKPGGLIMGFLKAERGVDDIVLPDKPNNLWLVKTILKIMGKHKIYDFMNFKFKDANVEEKFVFYYTLQLLYHHDLYFYIPSITPEEAKRIFIFKQFHDPQLLIDQGRKKLGKNATVAVFPTAGKTFPLVKQ